MEVNRDQLMTYLAAVKDPEVPVLDVVEMGIVRDARLEGDTLYVDITPTYSGCPAMKVIEDDIVATMQRRGFEQVVVNTVFEAPWTTDWMTDEARQKLKNYGIAPPEKVDQEALWMPFQVIQPTLPCPFCDATDTTLTSAFGATACKSMHYCNACQQPFEHFKCI